MLIAVCDCRVEDRQRIRTLIERYAKKRKEDLQIQEYSSGIEMCRDMDRLREADVVFLDIDIGEMDEIFFEKKKKSQRMTFSFVEGETELNVCDIIYIETDRHRNIFHTTDKQYSLYKKLNELEELLKDYDFVRVHQSFLVNMRYVEKISSYTLRLTTGQELSVPKSRYPYVKKAYADYQGIDSRFVQGAGDWCRKG